MPILANTELANGGLPLVIDWLICPVCGKGLELAGAIVHCTVGHSFDLARQGYVSLLRGGKHAHTGDTSDMVSARARFLDYGYFASIANETAGALPVGITGLCVDLAGGIGYYLRAVLEAHPTLIGLNLELSTAALKRTAQNRFPQGHERMAAVGADVWQPLPIQTGSAASVLSVFGPRNVPEIKRILRDDGLLVVVTPTQRHLAELVHALKLVTVDPQKQERLDSSLHEFVHRSTHTIEYTVELEKAAVLDVVVMGPSVHHLPRATLTSAVSALADPMTVTVSVSVSAYSKDG